MDLTQLFSTGIGSATITQALLVLLASFALGQTIAKTYEWTFDGLSYSRSFMHALVLGTLVSAILMMSIGDNLARGLGILGTMALVRFRTNVRDARDMIFVFAALAIGVSVGVRSFNIAFIGTIGFCIASAALSFSPFGRKQTFDGLIRFWIPALPAQSDLIKKNLDTHCERYVLVALRDAAQGETLEYAYQVRMRNGLRGDALIASLSELNGVTGLSYMGQEGHGEL